MARVFLAEETGLEREVVVKVLAPHLVDPTLLQRFRNEVLQTARLQHPTIVSVFDVGDLAGDDGQAVPYYIMPYVRGESLRSRLLHEGTLSVGAATRVLRSVLDALAYAHSNGVVHRDIKPENIFLSGSNAVLADFGIAKAVAGPGRSANVTSPGLAVGTPAYMPLEQLAGEETDQRADLYSVGVVAYEMLAGRLPWDGRSTAEMLASQARGTMVPLQSLRTDVPASLASVIEKCLSADVAKRPGSAAEMLRVVEAVAFTPTTPSSVIARRLPRPALASRTTRIAAAAVLLVGVVWFGSKKLGGAVAGHRSVRVAMLYPDLDAQSRADSTLNEQVYHLMTSSLHPVLGLQLVGEISVPEMHDRGMKPGQIADSLRVDSTLALVLSPATNGEKLLQVELHERRENRQQVLGVIGPMSLKSLESITPDSVQTLLKALSGQVVTRLGLTSSSSAGSTTQKTEAFIAWSNGRDASSRRTPVGIRDAIRFYKRALALDPNYAQAHSDLSLALSNAMWYRYRTDEGPSELAASALRHANRAIELMPTFGDGYLAAGYLGVLTGAPIEYLSKNYDEARRLESANPYSRTWYVGLLAARGKLDEAMSQLDEEVQRDPTSPAQRITLALYALAAGRYPTAVRSAREAHVLRPDIALASAFELWGLLAMDGNAADECARVDAGPYLGLRALCLERAGKSSEARAVADSLSRIIRGSVRMDSTFDISLYVAEMALYAGAHRDHAGTDEWIRQVFRESPTGIDFRLMLVSRFFTREFVTLSDTLRKEGWLRVQESARKPERESEPLRE